jgi:hypothetical protein
MQSFLPAIATTTYFYIVLGGALAAATPWVTWIGFNPLNWHWLLLSLAGIFTLWGAIYLATYAKPELPVDTNVYFDEAKIPYYVGILGASKVCRVLNVHASYLDEAYSLLSSYPLLSRTISKYLAQSAPPRIWDFNNPSEEVGFWRGSPPAAIRRGIKQKTRFAMALVKAVLYPGRLIAHRLRTRYVTSLLEADLRTFGFGLPPDESRRSSTIAVERVLHKPYFETHSIDVSRALAEPRVRGEDGRDRFEFLWDDGALARRIGDSVLVKSLGEPLDPNQHRQLMALEERVREYFGVVGLRHSMYYDNDVVISSVADFLTGVVPSE